MPELPDVELYLHALRPRIVGARLERVRIASPFLLRTVDPPLQDAEGRVIRAVGRLGKRVVWHLDDNLFVVIHLMIAGRFRWRPPAAAIPAKVGLAAFDFAAATLLLTEAGARRRASLYIVRDLDALDPGGIDVLLVIRRLRARDHERESHAQARADRPAPAERHRQRLFRRDPSRCAAVAAPTDEPARPRGARPPPSGGHSGVDDLARPADRRDG